MMGKCGRVEGWFGSPSSLPECRGTSAGEGGCEGTYVWDISKTQEQAKQSCSNYWAEGLFNNYQCDGEPVKSRNTVSNEYYWSCREGGKHSQCLDPPHRRYTLN